MDSATQLNFSSSDLGHIDTHSINDCLGNSQKMLQPYQAPSGEHSLPSPSPSASSEADESLGGTIHHCASLDTGITSSNKRTAERANLDVEDVLTKKPRNEVPAMTPKAMTPESQDSSEIMEEKTSSAPQKKPRLTTKAKKLASKLTNNQIRQSQVNGVVVKDQVTQRGASKKAPRKGVWQTINGIHVRARAKFSTRKIVKIGKKSRDSLVAKFKAKGTCIDSSTIDGQLEKVSQYDSVKAQNGPQTPESTSSSDFEATPAYVEADPVTAQEDLQEISVKAEDAPAPQTPESSSSFDVETTFTYVKADPVTAQEDLQEISVKAEDAPAPQTPESSSSFDVETTFTYVKGDPVATQEDAREISVKAENTSETPEPVSSPDIEAASANLESDPVYFKRSGAVGLKNLGNTCFGNTVVQALFNAPAFRDLLMKSQYSWSKKKDRNTNHIRKTAGIKRITRRVIQEECERDKTPVAENESLCAELGDLFHVMTYGRPDIAPLPKRSGGGAEAILSPHEFCDSAYALMPAILRHQQQDAQEFLQLSLQRMGKELMLDKMGLFGQPGAFANLDKVVSDASPVDTLFGGQSINKNQCNGCSYSTTNSANPDPFLCLGLVLPTGPEEEQDTGKGRKSTRTKAPKVVTLEACLDQLVSPEIIHPVNDNPGAEAFCPTCGPEQSLTKSQKISKCPQYLCVQIKRFQWANTSRYIGPYKDDTIVKPPTGSLDLGPYMTEDCDVKDIKYDLDTVIVHEGTHCNHGHYIAYIKHQDGIWREISDEKVSIVSEEVVMNLPAYLMFFSRVNTALTTLS